MGWEVVANSSTVAFVAGAVAVSVVEAVAFDVVAEALAFEMKKLNSLKMLRSKAPSGPSGLSMSLRMLGSKAASIV